MANKQITDLDSAAEVDETDLLLVRKSGQGEDSSISVQNFITSTGLPGVSGFYQYDYDPLTKAILLKPSNSTLDIIPASGMRIDFRADNDIDGQAYVTFDDIDLYPLYQYNKDLSFIPADINEGDYIESVLFIDITDNVAVYQTNIPTTQIYTNDYIAEGVVAVDELSTSYTLTSAIGVLAQSYYTGMSLIFASDIESKGDVTVNVDGLGDKVLTDKAGDMIANNLLEDQVILARYNGTDFIKSYFSEDVPEAPEIPADAFDEEGEIIINNVPDDNKIQVTVGTAGNDYLTILEALEDLDNNYGSDGGNRLATILLSDTYVWNQRIALLNKDYSWITIHSSNPITTSVPSSIAITLSKSSINISGNYTIATNTGFIECLDGSDACIKNAIINKANTSSRLILVRNSIMRIYSANITTTGNVITCTDSPMFEIKDSTINQTVYGGGEPFERSTVQMDTVILNLSSNLTTNRCEVSINNCTINSTFSTYAYQSVFDSNLFLSNTSINTTATTTNTTLSAVGSIGTVKNCFISANNNNYSLRAQAGTRLSLDGGTYESRIEATDSGTVLYLINNPSIVTALEAHGGIIQTIPQS